MEIAAEQDQLRDAPNIVPLLEAFPVPAVILNSDRQIVLHNSRFIDAMPDSDVEQVFGLRVGEAVCCVNAADAPSGCGTGEACNLCGAVLATLDAQDGRRSVEECRITVTHAETVYALDFRVLAVPLHIPAGDFTVLSLIDISDQKRRRVLERIFFHDVLNTAGGLRSLAEIIQLGNGQEHEGIVGDMESMINQLIDEIETQRDLLAAESSDLAVSTHMIVTDDILDHLTALYRFNHLTQNRHFRTVNLTPGQAIITDATLLSRAIGNLVKNALEATDPGGTVTLTCEQPDDERLCFSVHNPGMIPKHIRLQIFQRSFSTKGPGRGIGTYSVRLLVEQYLRGSIRFSTDEADGTRFDILLPLNGEAHDHASGESS